MSIEKEVKKLCDELLEAKSEKDKKKIIKQIQAIIPGKHSSDTKKEKHH